MRRASTVESIISENLANNFVQGSRAQVVAAGAIAGLVSRSEVFQ